MKNLNYLFVCFLFCLISCEKETIEITNMNAKDSNSNESIYSTKSTSYFAHQMIVQYESYLTEAERQTMRDEYKVVRYKNCSCADPTLELWMFAEDEDNGGLGTIEEIVLGAKEDDDLEGVGFNSIINHQGQHLDQTFGVEGLEVALTNVVPSNDNVTIAIIDTGVDYNYFGFSEPFLYNSLLSPRRCEEGRVTDYFGWDFVNQDNDPFDDYGHGTVVSSIIYEKLNAHNVPFQILPIKTFNEYGRGNYFDILCGFQYAANNEDVDVVNMSFGWYNGNYQMLERFVDEAEESVVVTSSAGNDRINTDQTSHYPSNFESNNVLSIAALSENIFAIDLAHFSNYGYSTVDVAALGENIPFMLDPNEEIHVSGTSFSNAFATAFCGQNYSVGMDPQQLKEATVSNTIQHSELTGRVQYSSYVPFN